LTLHPSAAAKRNIQAGDLLRVFNDRGACVVGAVISENIKEDVVILPTGAWFAPSANMAGLEMNGNPNVLTKDKGTSSLAQGPSAHTCLVEVVKLSAQEFQALGVGS
jgi:biotin/methionine sulfoxide reductase